jgi:hypothetical protein
MAPDGYALPKSKVNQVLRHQEGYLYGHKAESQLRVMPNVPGLRCTRIEQSQLLKESAKGDPGLVGILVLNHELRSL